MKRKRVKNRCLASLNARLFRDVQLPEPLENWSGNEIIKSPDSEYGLGTQSVVVFF